MEELSIAAPQPTRAKRSGVKVWRKEALPATAPDEKQPPGEAPTPTPEEASPPQGAHEEGTALGRTVPEQKRPLKKPQRGLLAPPEGTAGGGAAAARKRERQGRHGVRHSR